jgi:hypothetical protein
MSVAIFLIARPEDLANDFNLILRDFYCQSEKNCNKADFCFFKKD